MHDLIIIGAGAIGSAAARELARYQLDILVLEKESDVGQVTSSANSAIVHSGYDPVPGSEKAVMNVLGNQLYDQMCEELDIDMRKIGSLTIATNDEEVEILRELEERGRKNGVPVEMLDHDMVYNCERWHPVKDPVKKTNYRSYSGWQSSVKTLREMITGRGPKIIRDFVSAKGISDELVNRYFSKLIE